MTLFRETQSFQQWSITESFNLIKYINTYCAMLQLYCPNRVYKYILTYYQFFLFNQLMHN